MEKIEENDKIKKIAITGGIGVGKSTVCNILEKLGNYVIKTDELVHHLLSPQSPTGKKVQSLLGNSVLRNSTIDRKKIAEIVFSDLKKLKALEKILHPEVWKELKQIYEKIKENKKYTFFIVEIPLVFEAKQESFFDFILCVNASEEICLQRAHAQISEQEYKKRMQNQLSQVEKCKKADFVLENNKDVKQLENNVRNLHKKLIQKIS